MRETLTLKAIDDTLRHFRARVDPSEVPRVIHVCGPDRFYYEVMDVLRKTIATEKTRSPSVPLIFADAWYGLQIKRHNIEGICEAVCLEMADGSVMVLDLKGGGADDN